MANLTRKEAEALYTIFQRFALDDQKSYYRNSIDKARTAGRQVNQLRASFSLLAGFASALAGLLVAVYGAGSDSCNPATANCAVLSPIVIGLLIATVIAPVIGGALGTLMDLFQWDRLSKVYEGALQNIEVADALSPDRDDTDDKYFGSLSAYAEGTLSVMRDESAQWGQLIRPPRQLEEFLAAQERRIENLQETGAGMTASGRAALSNKPDFGNDYKFPPTNFDPARLNPNVDPTPHVPDGEEPSKPVG